MHEVAAQRSTKKYITSVRKAMVHHNLNFKSKGQATTQKIGCS